MEHFKSTIVTTAVLVAGLITAAHVMHPRDPSSEMRRGSPVAASTDAAAAWSDPPARASQAAMSDSALVRPASFTLLPIAMTASLSGAEDRFQDRPVRRTEHAHARRPGSFATRGQPAAARIAQQVPTPVASTAQTGRAAQGDPIGNLMKALGLGRDREG